ncbi:MAG: alpha-glucan family phosphorylase [Candidatus Heimdallarchaeota archaeon]|nr:alpha-glucan family phosphorylase [Candidatus Heimdallarchaeota archaeon]
MEDKSIDNNKIIDHIHELANNLWWSWNYSSRDLFRALNQRAWNKSRNNPIWMFSMLTDSYIENKLKDNDFLEKYRVAYDRYLTRMHKDDKYYPQFTKPIIYISSEFGLHQSLPFYSGGLGIMAGDFLKEAADLNIPLIGMGFLFSKGTFKQHVFDSGKQEEEFTTLNLDKMPITPFYINDNEVKLSIRFNGSTVIVKVWQVKLAKNSLFLFDTNLEENDAEYRKLSAQLYDPDIYIRQLQKIILLFSSVELVNKMQLDPLLYHLNTPDSALITFKLFDMYLQSMSFTDALLKIKNHVIYTLYSNDNDFKSLTVDELQDFFSNTLNRLGEHAQSIISLGMNATGFDCAKLMNNCSHKIVSVGNTLSALYNDKYNLSLPIIRIGVHAPSWICGPIRRLFAKYISYKWINFHDDELIWDNLDSIPNDEFWKAKLSAKRHLFAHIREMARKQQRKGKMSANQVVASGALLDADVFTIGIARRVTKFKRANLIFNDIERIRDIINNVDMPVQIIFAGKAHPGDEPGKHILEMIYKEALNVENRGRVAFLENYDLYIGRLLVQGVDLWLNNPIKNTHSSGTSGMKAAMNGVLNLSNPEGWWAEAAEHGINGWVFESSEKKDQEGRDNDDANAIYNLLENEIIPIYYARDGRNTPNLFVEMGKQAMRTVISSFSSRRMVKEYIELVYNEIIE